MVFSLCACNGGNSAGGQASITPPSNTDFWGKPSDTPSQGGGSGWDTDLTPDINVTIIGGGQKEDNIESEIEAGIIDNIPRIICCQSTESMAITNAINNDDFSEFNATTRADSISVGLPANGRMARRYVLESEGWAVAVTDKEILDSQLELTAKAGVLAEPAAACAYAAFKKDKEHFKEVLGEDATAVVLLTGTGFKDMKAFDGRVSLPDAIENSIEEVKKLSF